MTQLSVLVVDRNRDITAFLDRFLAQEGHRVRVAHDAATAIVALRSAEFDGILVDVSLPAIEGLDLLETLRDAAGDTAVVIMTTVPSVREILEALGLHIVAYLQKPFTLAELRCAIGSLAGSRGSRSTTR